MSALLGFSWLNSPAWLPLVSALLHTLWQGALAAAGLFLALRLVPARRANLRYGLATAALTLVLLSGIASWALLDTLPPRLPGTMFGRRTAGTVAGNSPNIPRVFFSAALLAPDGSQKLAHPADGRFVDAREDASGDTQTWVHRVAVFWLLGVSVCLLRAARGASGAGRLRRRCRELTNSRILALAEELRVRLGLSRRVRFLVSAEIGVPLMMGVLWPAVLLPASMLTGVPPEQLRAILAHELAHIRRWDYLSNLAQMLVEALLFFNPFVWWISWQIRVEREACCDQLAACECQSPASYVEALVTVIERSRPAAAPLLAASGPPAQGGTALDRARRLLVPGYQPVLRLRWFSLAMVLLLSGLALSGLWLGSRAVAQTVKTIEPKTEPKKADEQPARTLAAAARSPTPSAPPVALSPTLPYKLPVTPEIKKVFPSGDGIEVQTVAGNAADFQVGGTYRISGVCRQQTLENATLYVGNTAEAGADAIATVAGSSLYQALPKGSTEFDFTFKLLRTGVLHLTVYDLDNHDKDDNAFAGIFLGKVDAAEPLRR